MPLIHVICISFRPLAKRFRLALFLVALAGIGTVAVELRAADKNGAIYPLQVGNRWTYLSGELEIVEEVTGIETVGKEECARVETQVNGRVVTHELITVRADGIYRVSVGDDLIEPPLCFLKYPSQSGSAWSVASKVNGMEISGEFSPGTAVVEVPAGKYRTITSQGDHFQTQGQELQFTYYFAPGVGKVRQLIGANGKTMELQLKEFRPAP
jgi:hypothetical protein